MIFLSEIRNIGISEYWNNIILEFWNIGISEILEYRKRNIVRSEYQRVGILEDRNKDRIVKSKFDIPTFRYYWNSEYWNIGISDYRNIEISKSEYWIIEILEYLIIQYFALLKVGILEYQHRNRGILEHRNIGISEYWKI